MKHVLEKVSMFGMLLLVAIVPGTICFAQVNNQWCTTQLAGQAGRASQCIGSPCATQVNFCLSTQYVALEVVELDYPVCRLQSGFNCTEFTPTKKCTNIQHYVTLAACTSGATPDCNSWTSVLSCSTP